MDLHRGYARIVVTLDGYPRIVVTPGSWLRPDRGYAWIVVTPNGYAQ